MKLFSLIIIFALFSGCSKGTRIGNPPTQVSEISFKIVGSNSSFLNLSSELSGFIKSLDPKNLSYFPNATQALKVKSSSGIEIGTFTISSASLNLSSIRFADGDTPSETENFDLAGPFVVNLLENTTSPEIPKIQLEAKSYTGIKMKMEKSTTPGNLLDRSLAVTGSYSGLTGSGTVTQVPTEIYLELSEEFELRAASGRALNLQNANTEILASFRLERWLNFQNLSTNPNGLDFTDIPVISGQIILDPSNSPNDTEAKILEAIKEAVKLSAEFGFDSDGDGTLNSNEDLDGVENEDESDWD